MCTSIAVDRHGFYFGRNMDLEGSFGERIVTAPRDFIFEYRKEAPAPRHYAVMGMAAVMDGYPLFADAMNERGLCMAGLNFPGNARYDAPAEGKYRITPFELIPWVLGSCGTVDEAERLLKQTALITVPFSESVPLTPLHWHIADGKRSLAAEPMADGLRLYENAVGVLTNNPPFPYHAANLGRYANLGVGTPKGDWLDAGNISFGLDGVGLPGDYSSASRFVRAAFLKKHLICEGDTAETVAAVFNLLGAVAPPKGVVITPEGKPHYTTYSCCMDTERGDYYCKAYGEHAIRRFPLPSDLSGTRLRAGGGRFFEKKLRKKLFLPRPCRS